MEAKGKIICYQYWDSIGKQVLSSELSPSIVLKNMEGMELIAYWKLK